MWSKKGMAAVLALITMAATVMSVPVLASEQVRLEAVLTDSEGAEFGEAEFRGDDRMRLEVEAQDLEGMPL